MKLTFLGAAGEVTGSQHLLEHHGFRVLLDCGLFQGRRADADRKNRTFDCDPESLDAVFLSHAHIDHCGNLPGLVRAGFDGPIFCTPATAEVAAIMMADSAHIQEEDAAYMAKKLGPDSPKAEPLYTEDDARKAASLFRPCPYGEWTRLSKHLKVRFTEAGHILGSAIVELAIGKVPNSTRVVFTGDLGRRGMPLLRDPQPVPGCDVLISECTYGTRVHPPPADLATDLLRMVMRAVNNGGRVVIPAFSLGRTQQVVYYLNELFEADVLPRIPVYVDSPLASRLTKIYQAHQDLLDEQAQRALLLDDDLFDFEGLLYTPKRHDSIAINEVGPPFVVISASGMCDNGRIRHHLKRALPAPHDTVCLIGYQAPHTTGRAIADGNEVVRLFGRDCPVRCHVETFSGLSAHADVTDLKWWYEQLAADGGVGECYLVHGEPDVAEKFAGVVRDCCDEDPVIPEHGESFEI